MISLILIYNVVFLLDWKIYLYLDDDWVLVTTLGNAPARLSQEKSARLSELAKSLNNEDGVETESGYDTDY